MNKIGEKVFIRNWDDDDNNNLKPFDPCSLYNWRLDWLEEKVRQHHNSPNVNVSGEQYQKWWDEEERVFQNNKKTVDKVNKMQKSIGIIVPACSNHLKFLRACLRSCQATGYFTLLAYDNPFHDPRMQTERRMPTAETFMIADAMVMKHKTWGGGVGIPHAWNMFYGLRLLESFGFDYVFNLNGDCIMEKPENFPKLIELLGDADIIACESIPEKKYCGTMAWLAKMDVAASIWNEYIEKLYHFNIGNAERRMGEWLHRQNKKIVPVNNPDEAHFKPPGSENATFRTLLGMRHLHVEHKVRRTLKMEPIEKKYFEVGPEYAFISGHDHKTLFKYWDTGDKKFLEEWWG